MDLPREARMRVFLLSAGLTANADADMLNMKSFFVRKGVAVDGGRTACKNENRAAAWQPRQGVAARGA